VCGRILSLHDVLKIQGDGPRDPGHEDAVAASPRRVAGTGRSVGEDVAVEDVAAKNEEKLVPPLSVGGRGGVEEDGDQVLDVRDPGGLKVEVGDHGVILATRGSSTRRRQRSGRELRRRGDTLPRRGVKRSTSTTWRARTSAVESSCSQARAATHTHTPRRRLSRSWRSLGPQQGRCWWRPRWWDAVTCLGGRRWQRRGWPWAACEAAERGENADGWTARGEGCRAAEYHPRAQQRCPCPCPCCPPRLGGRLPRRRVQPRLWQPPWPERGPGRRPGPEGLRLPQRQQLSCPGVSAIKP
jgi:hypothetical protein